MVASEQRPAFWRPWTYVVPLTTAFTVIDEDGLSRSRADDQPLVEFILYRFEMGAADRLVHRPHLLNCASGELVPLDDASGRPQTEALRRLDDGDPLRPGGLHRRLRRPFPGQLTAGLLHRTWTAFHRALEWAGTRGR